MKMYDNQFDNHYHITPPECKTEKECWEDLAKYLSEYAADRIIYFRETPTVVSELDFDTKEWVHRGIVRFAASQEQFNNTVIVPIGAATWK